MPISKLKNIVIFVLVLVSILLLFLIVPQKMEERDQARLVRQQLSVLCAQGGLSIQENALPDTRALYVVELTQSSTAYLRVAEALLDGAILMENDAAYASIAYTAENGECRFANDGGFSATLIGQKATGDPERHAASLLKKMGFSTQAINIGDDEGTIVAQQRILGVPLFSDALVLRYTDDTLTEIGGDFYCGAAARIGNTPCVSCEDAVIAFLSGRDEIGWVGNEISKVVQGYARAESASIATTRLSPVWMIETDAGSFLVDGLTRELRVR